MDSSMDSRDNSSYPAKQKLCGFLTKLSGGLLKSSKCRWFSFRPDTCDLFYYRSPNADVWDFDGKIPLRRASFNFSASDLKENIFTISADGTEHMLQASDRDTLMWWLQGLQQQRKMFNMIEDSDASNVDEWPGSLLGQSIFWIPNNTNTNPGLLNIGPENTTHSVVDASVPTEVCFPSGSLGIRSKSVTVRSASLSGKFSRLGINNVLSSAGEALRSQANKLRPLHNGSNRRHSASGMNYNIEDTQKMVPAFSSTGNLNPKKDTNCNSFITCLKRRVSEMQLEIDLMETKLQSKEEVIHRLNEDLEKYEAIKEQERTFSKDDYKLRSHLTGLKLKKERLEQEKEEGVAREKQLREEISMFAETVMAKDELVRELSLKVDELERKYQLLEQQHSQLKSEKNEEFVVLTPADAEESFAVVKDRAEGYMMQNQLLNTEIKELSELRQFDAQKIERYHDKVQYSEAKYLRLHSKYLILLSEMNKPSADNVGLVMADTNMSSSEKERKEMLKNLISDALQEAEVSSTDQGGAHARVRKYDQFGFNNFPDDDPDAMLQSTATQLEKRFTKIIQSLQEFNVSVAVKWQNFLALNKELQRCDEVKALIRMGIPHELRPQVWSWMVTVITTPIRQKLERTTSYYEQLGMGKEVQLHSKQIELDLLRTLPHNKHFSSLSSYGIQQLRRVLHAYSKHNPSIGYCQGLNRIAAVALLYLCEEEAFWCLVAVVECIMPDDYYSTTLTASQADQRVFRDLMAEKLPRLHRHLEIAGVDSSLITFNWLLCIYCDNVPPETMLHIWDCFLYEGSKVLFRFGLAFFKHTEEEILQLTDYIGIFNFMRLMSHRMHDVRKLTQLAFAGMNPFPMRRITRLRQIHMEKVAMELRELDELRRGCESVRHDSRRVLDSDED